MLTDEQFMLFAAFALSGIMQNPANCQLEDAEKAQWAWSMAEQMRSTYRGLHEGHTYGHD